MYEEFSSETNLSRRENVKIKPPVEVAPDAVMRLARLPQPEQPEWLQTVLEARTVLERMPAGKDGVVVGSGGNSQMWKDRGWRTLDIDERTGADIIIDANRMSSVIMPRSEDYVFAEAIKFDPKAEEGVGYGTLLLEANTVLKNGGILIIESAHKENKPSSTLPDRHKFVKWMARTGFDTVAELHQILTVKNPNGGPDIKSQKVIYYGRKVAEGVNIDRF